MKVGEVWIMKKHYAKQLTDFADKQKLTAWGLKVEIIKIIDKTVKSKDVSYIGDDLYYMEYPINVFLDVFTKYYGNDSTSTKTRLNSIEGVEL